MFVYTTNGSSGEGLSAVGQDMKTVVDISGSLNLTSTPKPMGSPDKKFIAFVSVQGKLYVADPTGATPPVVVSSANDSVNAFSWSKDSSHLLYTTDTCSSTCTSPLHVVKVDGTGDVTVDPDAAHFLWSPDSLHFAWIASPDNTGYEHLWIANADGSSPVEVPQTNLAKGATSMDSLAWAPDGAHLTYFAQSSTDGASYLFVVGSDGKNELALTNSTMTGTVSYYFWAPDSSRIAYILNDFANGVDDLWTVLPDGTGVANVSGVLSPYSSVYNTDVAWAPDGKHIAFTMSSPFGLYVATPDGATKNLVTSNVKSPPQWAQSSSFVAYLSDDATAGTNELHVALADGSRFETVSATPPANESVSKQFAWSSDAKSLYYLLPETTGGQPIVRVGTPTLTPLKFGDTANSPGALEDADLAAHPGWQEEAVAFKSQIKAEYIAPGVLNQLIVILYNPATSAELHCVYQKRAQSPPWVNAGCFGINELVGIVEVQH